MNGSSLTLSDEDFEGLLDDIIETLEGYFSYDPRANSVSAGFASFKLSDDGLTLESKMELNDFATHDRWGYIALVAALTKAAKKVLENKRELREKQAQEEKLNQFYASVLEAAEKLGVEAFPGSQGVLRGRVGKTVVQDSSRSDSREGLASEIYLAAVKAAGLQ